MSSPSNFTSIYVFWDLSTKKRFKFSKYVRIDATFVLAKKMHCYMMDLSGARHGFGQICPGCGASN